MILGSSFDSVLMALPLGLRAPGLFLFISMLTSFLLSLAQY